MEDASFNFPVRSKFVKPWGYGHQICKLFKRCMDCILDDCPAACPEPSIANLILCSLLVFRWDHSILIAWQFNKSLLDFWNKIHILSQEKFKCKFFFFLLFGLSLPPYSILYLCFIHQPNLLHGQKYLVNHNEQMLISTSMFQIQYFGS